MEKEERSYRATPVGPESHNPGGVEGTGLLEGRDPWEQDTQILAWPASPSPMAWVLGGHWAWPQPFPLLFLRQTAPGADTASCESSGGLLPPGSEVGGHRGEGTMDWSPRWIMPVGMPGILGY